MRQYCVSLFIDLFFPPPIPHDGVTQSRCQFNEPLKITQRRTRTTRKSKREEASVCKSLITMAPHKRTHNGGSIGCRGKPWDCTRPDFNSTNVQLNKFMHASSCALAPGPVGNRGFYQPISNRYRCLRPFDVGFIIGTHMGSSSTGMTGGPQSPHTGAHGASEIDIILKKKNISLYRARKMWL